MKPYEDWWVEDVSSWGVSEWSAWDRLAQSDPENSFFLDSRSVQALFEDRDRVVRAVVWHEHAGRAPEQWLGVAVVEDTWAESHRLEKHLASGAGWFAGLSRLMHGRKGVLRFPVRVMGSVLGSGGHAYRFGTSVPAEQRRVMVGETLQRSLRAAPGPLKPRVVLVKDFPKADPEERIGGASNWLPNWVDLEFDPIMQLSLNPEWNSLDDYLGELRTKSRTKVKRILACSEGCSIQSLSLTELEAQIDEIHSLYGQVYGEASFRLGTLMPKDLIEAKRSWGDRFRVEVIRHNDRTVAFYCGYQTATTVEAFFVGFHRGLNRDLSLYQRMLIEFIRWGIEAGVQYVVMGRTALDIKSSIGALPESWYCSVWFKNPAIHRGVRLVARRSWPRYASLKRPWKLDAYPVTHQPPAKGKWM